MGEVSGDLLCDMESQTRFPDASRSGEREQAYLLAPQHIGQRCHVFVTADQGRERLWHGERDDLAVVQRCRRNPRPRRSQEAGPLLGPKPKRIRQQRDRGKPGRAARVPLQLADGLGAQPGSLGQGLLRQAGPQSQSLQQRSECTRCRWCHSISFQRDAGPSSPFCRLHYTAAPSWGNTAIRCSFTVSAQQRFTQSAA